MNDIGKRQKVQDTTSTIMVGGQHVLAHPGFIHLLVACVINLTRLARWIQGEVPSQAHATAFTRLFHPVLA